LPQAAGGPTHTVAASALAGFEQAPDHGAGVLVVLDGGYARGLFVSSPQSVHEGSTIGLQAAGGLGHVRKDPALLFARHFQKQADEEPAKADDKGVM
jgi:hypothetical protein